MTNNMATNDAIARMEEMYRMDWERTYPQPVDRVWAAISTADQVSVWMRYPTRLELRAGGVIHIDFSAEGSQEGIVCNVEPPTLLIYTWGDSLVKWTLEESPDGTRLRFSHIGVRSDLAAGLGAGWHAFLDQLEDHITGTSRPRRYRELKARYEMEAKAQPERSAVL